MRRALPYCRVVAALAVVAALGGCGDTFESANPWFRKPFYLTGQNSGYTFSDVQQARQEKAITQNDLIEANGSCPAAPLQPSPAQGAGPVGTPDSTALIDEGIALGMSECDVVHRAGQPSNIDIGKNANGVRTVTLTYAGGPRPGIYRFESGRLMEMDRVAEPVSPPATAKKKPAKATKPKTTNAT